MSDSMLVRASRDGDQFHYLWAARRTLSLLNQKSGLVAITIEGASTSELSPSQVVEDGEELIDIAEYYGSSSVDQATLIRYMQLKHSTLHADEAWQPSGLKKTITGFYNRFTAIQAKLPTEPLHERFEFWFVTNRPISADFIEAVEDAAAQRIPRHPATLTKLKSFVSSDEAKLAVFCKSLRLEGRQDNYWNQRNILTQDISGYLPSLDVDAPTRLKELITRKALSESADNPAITKMDVLRVLQTDETALFPAPCLIKAIDNPVQRLQEVSLVESIVGATGIPVIVDAQAGVGKSIFATRIGTNLPVGSVSILYDCFGNGQYRSASGYRHRHRTALVQIANELSVQGLCHPLIPTPSADSSSYMRAFLHRIKQSISALRAKHANGLLCIVVDAADNAQMAAVEIDEPRSFIRDLLREKLPDGVRLVALCRPHRVELIDPPPYTLQLGLEAFNLAESAVHLRIKYPDANQRDVDEFHRLSSHNPRVQALALSRDMPLSETLRLLGPNPTTVESTINDILAKSIAKLRDNVGYLERAQVDLICAGLAALRPLVPISVLASMSAVNEAAIRSFVLDLGRPLIANGDTIQFFDEPAETWFREHFRPDQAQISEFINRLKTLSTSSAYVASVLPQLMLEAGLFSQLVDLALTSTGLPESNPIERRDVELQRLQFAIKAGLRTKRYTEVAKLALKAGGESAGNDRQRHLLQNNIDLAGLFLESNSAQELVSRHIFNSSWVGSHHAYEAALLSKYSDLIGDARSRLRMAEEWLRNWSRLTPIEREKESVSDEDRAVMAIAHFHIHGAKAAADSLRKWTPRELSYFSGRIIARQFLDQGRYDDLDDLALAANNDLWLILAIAVEARNLHRFLPRKAAERGFKLLFHRLIKIEDPRGLQDLALRSVTAMVETAYHYGFCDASSGKSLLERYLPESPPLGISSCYSGLRPQYMRAYALYYALSGNTLKLIDLATPQVRKQLEDQSEYANSSDLREFKEDIGALLPWYHLWSQVFLGLIQHEQLAEEVAKVKDTSSKAESFYREVSHTANEIARLWIDILLEAGSPDETAVRSILEWSSSPKRQLYTTTLNHLARLCAQTVGVQALAFEFASKAFLLHRDERSDAQSKAEGYVAIARSILVISKPDAEAYFNKAVEVASKIGDENLARWDALIDLGERAVKKDRPVAEVAYKFARCAELTREYVERDKHFAWSASVEAITKLCPSSALAIMSRWRDRRFGDNYRVLVPAIESLVSNGSINPLDALAMVSFRADWDEVSLLKGILQDNTRGIHLKAINHVYRYMRLVGKDLKSLRQLEAIAESIGIELSGLKELITHREIVERASRNNKENSYAIENKWEEPKRNWDEIFLQCDLATPVGISVAYQRFRNGEPPFYTEVFLNEGIKRIPIGDEAEFLKAFDSVPEFSLHTLSDLLDVFPSQWKARLGIQAAFATTVKGFCRRFYNDIKRSRYYEVLPFEKVCETSGLSEDHLLDVILAAIGDSADLSGAGRLFSLVGLLVNKLTHDEALNALSFGLDLFNEVLEQNDGDGPWTIDLTPPEAVEDSLAGYIWAGLASPKATIRWEAAHVIVTLCTFGRTRILDGLFRHATNNTTKPFGDLRLAFYSLHAQQWLLIAAARAVLGHGAILVPYLEHFLTQANPDQPHVLIRLFAARTALTLAKQQLVTLHPEIHQQLQYINSSPFEVIARNPSEEFTDRKIMGVMDDELPEGDKYFFGIDFGPYWLQPLGRCFGVSQVQVECEALKVIRGTLGFKGRHRSDEDERARLRMYPPEEMNHSHGSYPRVDGLAFYHSYHGMLIVAGKLLSTVPLFKGHNDWEDNRFLDWLQRYDISRTDGRWLADRRDPQPIDGIIEREGLSQEEWLRSISVEAFDKALNMKAGFLTVWGKWANIHNGLVESISVSSALVSSARSHSLLRALQTVDNPYDFRIPDAQDHLQISQELYQLKGWVVDRTNERGIDDRDPWAGDVRFPAPEPAQFVIDMMQLSTDEDRRFWFSSLGPSPMLYSEMWGYFSEKDDYEQPSGQRLQASYQFICEFLKVFVMDLIVEIQIKRRFPYGRYEGKNNDELTDISPSFRIFLVKADGTIRTL